MTAFGGYMCPGSENSRDIEKMSKKKTNNENKECSFSKAREKRVHLL